MLTHELARTRGTTQLAPAEFSAVTSLMSEEEAPISDAPLYTPEDAGVGILLLGLLLSPKPPKDR
ncbi:hypothetical protein GXW83_16050 [Streptacidiphilus sp. PB12-B1b]|uniref:hypothetical protein n=1 Tax=Streptacidiphilus sp. PB12-B1b TaxID=2705012 RepID=UPI0015FC81C0|nr:hypothetical protein [Streptacidiphilus sp. PB12-B1b]QMU76991.1 hypothetical protein GXW83_16050 [Streptacidiphilus sp. PB12-B1b]